MVAVHQYQSPPSGVGQGLERGADAGAGLARIVVAHPGFEQVAQHVQRVSGPRPALRRSDAGKRQRKLDV